MNEQTLAIIKPDIISRKLTGFAISAIEENFHIKRMVLVKFTEELVKEFYAEHKAKPFFHEIVRDMTKDYSILMVLEGDKVIQRWRDAMGDTDPAKAAKGSLRQRFGLSIGLNSFHGSLKPADADREINLLFA